MIKITSQIFCWPLFLWLLGFICFIVYYILGLALVSFYSAISGRDKGTLTPIRDWILPLGLARIFVSGLLRLAMNEEVMHRFFNLSIIATIYAFGYRYLDNPLYCNTNYPLKVFFMIILVLSFELVSAFIDIIWVYGYKQFILGGFFN